MIIFIGLGALLGIVGIIMCCCCESRNRRNRANRPVNNQPQAQGGHVIICQQQPPMSDRPLGPA